MAERLKETINSLLSEMMKEVTKAVIKKILELLPTGFTCWTLLVFLSLFAGAFALLFISDGSGLCRYFINTLLSEMMKEVPKAVIKKILELLPTGFTCWTLLVSLSLFAGAFALLFISDGSGLCRYFINTLLSEMMKKVTKAVIKKILELLPTGFTCQTLLVYLSLFAGAFALLFIGDDGSGLCSDFMSSVGVAMIQIAILVIMG